MIHGIEENFLFLEESESFGFKINKIKHQNYGQTIFSYSRLQSPFIIALNTYYFYFKPSYSKRASAKASHKITCIFQLQALEKCFMLKLFLIRKGTSNKKSLVLYNILKRMSKAFDTSFILINDRKHIRRVLDYRKESHSCE